MRSSNVKFILKVATIIFFLFTGFYLSPYINSKILHDNSSFHVVNVSKSQNGTMQYTDNLDTIVYGPCGAGAIVRGTLVAKFCNRHYNELKEAHKNEWTDMKSVTGVTTGVKPAPTMTVVVPTPEKKSPGR